MKILVLNGSYRTHGNTASVTSIFADQLRLAAQHFAIPLEIKTINLGHQIINICRGCRVCFEKGETNCPLKDDLLSIKAQMDKSDILILASPVYVDDVSGIVKNWIDRMAHVCHRPQFAGKYAYVIATTGASPTGRTLRTMNLTLRLWGYTVLGQSGFTTGALMKKANIQHKFNKKIHNAARRILKAVRKEKHLKPSFLSLAIFKIQQNGWSKRNQDLYDYYYWQTQGWTNPRTTYFISQKAFFVKIALARLTGKLIALFMGI
jgi:multimeric flavodoxin WrbA